MPWKLPIRMACLEHGVQRIKVECDERRIRSHRSSKLMGILSDRGTGWFYLDAVAALRGIFSLNRKYQDLHFRKVTLATGQKTDQGNWGGSGSVRNLLE